ncbi:beta-ketoacyl-[acyl-carrier-protein] synthase family protein [Sulfurivermis fontis]|uniref:beta-ketoacyl-[acyl-carrier-protein] synthase family protein n=1 Tax=Sulfurivermis fontis TaxID=1972068 RepID=UPI000FD8F82C|nr:beta-ketoacyl-[acyl-carrier-protein] synthase family protein [Sulfurivermis fontis]
MAFESLVITAYSTISALGHGRRAALDALLAGRGGLRPCDYPGADLETWIGRVDGIEGVALPDELTAFDCRNNRLALLGLECDGFAAAVAAARARHGAARIGVFLGTSTSGIEATEQAYRQRGADSGQLPTNFDYRHTHNTFSVADFTRRYLGLEGPALVISTACSSSAKVFATASRYIRAGWCDAAVVGGVDSLCLTTLYGFNSLELVSRQPCRPWDVARDGINIGEAAGFALLEREGEGVRLLGYGESSDAYHMSTPHPEGEGALQAMQAALRCAGLEPARIDYINLHGTATPSNDRAEDCAVTRLFAGGSACSSTKGWTGHTLGAAGITEAIFCALAIEEGFIPASLNTEQIDPQLSAPIVRTTVRQPVRVVMTNSFGFGGSNCALILGRCV